MSKAEQNELYQLLSSAYQDVKDSDDEFAKILLKAMNMIDEGRDYKVMCTGLSRYCNQYLLRNVGNSPKSVIKLSELVQKISLTYRGVISLVFNFS